MSMLRLSLKAFAREHSCALCTFSNSNLCIVACWQQGDIFLGTQNSGKNSEGRGRAVTAAPYQAPVRGLLSGPRGPLRTWAGGRGDKLRYVGVSLSLAPWRANVSLL